MYQLNIFMLKAYPNSHSSIVSIGSRQSELDQLRFGGEVVSRKLFHNNNYRVLNILKLKLYNV